MGISRKRKSPLVRGAVPPKLSRRDVIAAAGMGGLMFWANGRQTLAATGRADAEESRSAKLNDSCVLVPTLTQGPFFVEEHLNRSDVRSNSKETAKGDVCPGLPLTLRLSVLALGGGTCTPLPGAQIDIWHCDALGRYSDVGNFGGADTRGQNFLRGFQATDSTGEVTFKTIYPGWYMGRAVHIHLKARLFDASKNTTTEATTQVFFEDGVTDAVYGATPPYNARGPRAMRNADDDIYGERPQLVLSLRGDSSTGYRGHFSLGLQVGSLGGAERQGPRPWRR